MPPQKQEKSEYGAAGLILDWGTALLFLAAFLLGESVEDMARGPEKLSALGFICFSVPWCLSPSCRASPGA